MKALGTLITLLFILALAGAGAAYVWFQDSVTRPGPMAEATVFAVSPGETLVSVANRAEAAGIIRDDRVLRLHARLKDQETAIKVGEFALPAEISIEEFLARLVAGDVVQYTITIPEGLTTAQIARRLEADDRLEGPLPDPLPPEGSLLPETYAFTSGTTRAGLLQRMEAEQDRLLERLERQRVALREHGERGRDGGPQQPGDHEELGRHGEPRAAAQRAELRERRHDERRQHQHRRRPDHARGAALGERRLGRLP